ncbi:hypothetical protein [Alteriqipengyuania lutimaris]|nr:hypothetical protein [Alteriqipengyuania lutimaris]MBB3034803.1 hypothetical protein [Alteriqipengyuania lutimaris]
MALALGGCVADHGAPDTGTSVSAPAVVAPPAPAAPEPLRETRILSQADADRLLGSSGMTLQWIGWDDRGPVSVYPDRRGVWWLSGRQSGPGGEQVLVEGQILEIGQGYFTLDGVVSIRGAPDAGRNCRADKPWHFAVTGNRQYYRLREFEWCDELTDYIDIYF